MIRKALFLIGFVAPVMCSSALADSLSERSVDTSLIAEKAAQVRETDRKAEKSGTESTKTGNNSDGAKSEASRADDSKTDAKKSDAAKTEPSKSEASKTDAAKPETTQTRVARQATIRQIIETTRAREMPTRMMDSLFDRLMEKQDATTEDVAAAIDEALLPADMSAADRARLQNSRAGRDKLEITKGYLNQLEVPRFFAVVLHHLLEEHYTDAELEQLLAFWQSPVGRKTIELMPSMSQDFAELAHQYFPPKLEEVQDQMIKDATRRGPIRRR